MPTGLIAIHVGVGVQMTESIENCPTELWTYGSFCGRTGEAYAKDGATQLRTLTVIAMLNA